MQRILVVDDNDENRYYLQTLLSAAGYEVAVARNGAEALQSALENPPVLIVTDILMPVMDGFTLCRLWRREPRLAGIPFVFYTATYTDPRDQQLGLSIGADEFLVKPIEPDTMLELVRNLLHRKETGTLPDRSTATPDADIFLREYNAALVRKLEDKLAQLEAANQKLADAEELIHAVLDNCPLPIMAADLEGKILLTNAAFTAAFGYSAAEATGRYCSELIVPPGVDSVKELLLRRMSCNEMSPQASKRRRKDGTLIDAEIYVGPMKIRDKVTGSLAIYRDVTEQRKLEEELRHSQKMDAMGRLAGGIAHDFNNLLMLISGYLGQMIESALPSKQQAACKEAIAATKRAASLTRQLLAFSRKHREEARVTDLNSVITSMQEILRSLATERIHLDVALSSDPVPVLADVPQLEMVVMNLAINAKDAMPEGGLLTIATRSQKQDSTTFAVLTVSDTGKGMTSDVRARIFEPFFTTKQTGKGTGLGLSNVVGIVQRYGGHIEVESKINQGTRFQVYIPETTVKSEAEETAISVPPARGKETILLAEDEAGIRAMTKAYLEGLGYHVIEAADGSEAVRISDEYQGTIDLVLTDLIMPALRGDAAVNAIRDRRAKVKALYISGGSPDQVENDHNIDVLDKPFEFPELGRRVRSVLDSDFRQIGNDKF